jgi:hypothetical protein
MEKATDSKIEEIVYFALKESIEFAKKSQGEFSLPIEKKIIEKYKLPDKLASIVERPVFWYLSDKKIVPSELGKWLISDGGKSLKDGDLKAMAKLVFKEYGEYLKSNFSNLY